MINALIGQKIDQTQRFLENGTRIPVTMIAVADNAVLQVKTPEKDKYTAVQLGFGSKRTGTKAVLGHVKKANLTAAPKVVREVRILDDATELPTVGDMLAAAAVFKPGDIVAVTGTSKGKGFAGVVKRHNFRGGPKTHGQSDRHRAPGSIGQTTTPGRVYRGKRMAGHMGVETVTVKNLTVVDIDPVNKMLYVAGLIPGHRNGWVFITRTGEDKKFTPLMDPTPPAPAEPEQTTPETQEVQAETPEVATETKEEVKAEEAKGEGK
jgi:large subunit ribosomal protein L3